MPTFLLYCLKAAGCLVAFYLFYKLLLSRDTLHRMNRVLLCGVLLLSLLLPVCVITIEKELPQTPVSETYVIPESYTQQECPFGPEEMEIPPLVIEKPEPLPEPFDWRFLFGVIYFTGLLVTLGWTIRNIVQVVRMTRRGRRLPLGNGKVLVLSDRACAPFSWMKYIVMSEEDYVRGGDTILMHEQAHLALGHSWDLLLVDLLSCLQWFNPAMWLLRAELRAVHEYEADERVLRAGVDAKDYQMLLIRKAVGGRWYSIANSLNHSNLKNRITMMLRKRSSGWARAKALYVLPLACLALGAFAQTSYVLPEDKTTKNSGNGEASLSARTDNYAAAGDEGAGTEEVAPPESRECVVELLANLERAAREAQTAVPTVHTLSGRVFGPDDKPLAGFEFHCSGGRRVVTDADGRFTITSAQPVRLFYFDRREKVFCLGNGPFLDRTDMEAEIRLKEGIEFIFRRTSGDPILYVAEGDPADWHFDRDRLPMLLYSGQELSPEFLQDFMAQPQLQIYGRVVKDPETIARYGTKSANGIVVLNFEESSRRHSWGWGQDEPWNPEWVELHLAWAGDARSDVLQARYEESWDAQLAADRQNIETHKPFSGFGSITQSDDGQVWTLTVSERGKRWAHLPFVPEAMLYLIDGKKVSQADFYKRYPEWVASVRLLKSAAAVRKYGKQGRCGAIEAASRRKSGKAAAAEKRVKPNPMAYLEGDFKPVDGKGTYTVTKIDRHLTADSDWDRIPLVLRDGRVSSIYIFSNPGIAEKIETIRIIDDIDPAMLARYGTEARNGIICVVTKTSEGDREETIYDRSNHPFRYLKGRFVSIDGRNTYKVSNLSLRNVTQTDPDSLPLVVVDDRVVPITALGELPARRIETLQVLDRDGAANDSGVRYGRKARNGVIRITTKHPAGGDTAEIAKHVVTVVSSSDAPGRMTNTTTVTQVPGTSGRQVTVRTASVSAEPLEDVVTMTYTAETGSVSGENSSLKEVGLMILNGEEISADRLSQLNPSQIDAIKVFKGEQAVERYGEKGAKGVIEITTKKSGERKFKRIGCAFINGSSYRIGPGLWRIKDTGFGFSISPQDGTRPLVMVDGELVDLSYLDDIDADAVATVQIVQPSAELVEQYGEQGYDGMIRFVTKEGRKKTKKIEAQRRKAARADNE